MDAVLDLVLEVLLDIRDLLAGDRLVKIQAKPKLMETRDTGEGR